MRNRQGFDDLKIMGKENTEGGTMLGRWGNKFTKFAKQVWNRANHEAGKFFPSPTPEWTQLYEKIPEKRIFTVEAPIRKVEDESKTTDEEILGTFFVNSCDGHGSESEQQVAALMNRVAETMRPLLIEKQGDNIYPSGATHPFDPQFKTHIKDIWDNPKLTAICDLVKIQCLGNHDENQSSEGEAHGRVKPKSIGSLAQILHTYGMDSVDPETGHSKMEPVELNAKLIEQLNQKSIKVGDLPKFFMPNSFFAIYYSNLPIKKFYINTAKYVPDFIDSFAEEKSTQEVNQAEWLEKNVKEAMDGGSEDMLYLHGHQGLDSITHRGGHKPDCDVFLAEEDFARLADIFGIDTLATIFKITIQDEAAKKAAVIKTLKTTSYNRILGWIIYGWQGLRFDGAVSGHDHGLAYLCKTEQDIATEGEIALIRAAKIARTKKEGSSTAQLAAEEKSATPTKKQGIFNIVSAGGSNKKEELHYRLKVKDWEQVPYHIFDGGFTALTVYRKEKQLFTRLDVFTLSGLHLRIDDIKNPKEVTLHPQVKTDNAYMQLRDIMLEAYKQYMDRLHQEYDHSVPPINIFGAGPEGVKRADYLRNLVNDFQGNEVLDCSEEARFSKLANNIIKELSASGDREGSLKILFANILKAKFGGLTFEEFSASPLILRQKMLGIVVPLPVATPAGNSHAVARELMSATPPASSASPTPPPTPTDSSSADVGSKEEAAAPMVVTRLPSLKGQTASTFASPMPIVLSDLGAPPVDRSQTVSPTRA